MRPNLSQPHCLRFACLFNDVYHVETNPNGIISLGVAENFLMAEELLTFMGRAFKESFTTADLSYGDHLWGSRRLMTALAGLYNTFVSFVTST